MSSTHFCHTKESSIFQGFLKWDKTDLVTFIGVNFKRKLESAMIFQLFKGVALIRQEGCLAWLLQTEHMQGLVQPGAFHPLGGRGKARGS